MTIPHPHQLEAIAHFEQSGCGIIGHDVGTGKSLTGLKLIVDSWQCERLLIVCPSGMLTEWPKQFAAHGFDEWMIVAIMPGMSATKRGQAIERAHVEAACDGRPLCVLINYEACLSESVQKAIRAVPWDGRIFDESQFIKGPDAKVSTFFRGIAHECPHRLGLTGTPAHDTPLDLWAQFQAIAPQVFPWSFYEFRTRYTLTEAEELQEKLPHIVSKQLRLMLDYDRATLQEKKTDIATRFGAFLGKRIDAGQWPPKDARDRAEVEEMMGRCYFSWRLKRAPWMRTSVVRYRNLDDMQARMAPYFHRVERRDVLDLPPFIDVTRTCTLSTKTRKAYDQMQEELRADVETGTLEAGSLIARATRLAQIAQGFCTNSDEQLVELSHEKRDLLMQVFAEIPDGDPVAVFGRFSHDLAEIHAAAAAVGRTSCEMSGPRKELAAFHSGEANVIAVEPRTGGAGVDLTRACVQVYMSHPWSLGTYQQTRGRVDRNGQTRPVTFIHLVTAETVDEDVMPVLAAKADVMSEALGEKRVAQAILAGLKVETRVREGVAA